MDGSGEFFAGAQAGPGRTHLECRRAGVVDNKRKRSLVCFFFCFFLGIGKPLF